MPASPGFTSPAQLQDHPLTCPPPVLDALSIDRKVQFAVVDG